MKKFLILFVFIFYSITFGKSGIDFETGLTLPGYNDVRIPGDTGTLFSLKDDFNLENTIFWRLKLNYSISTKHHLQLLLAPLRIEGSETASKSIFFNGTTFDSNQEINTIYRFDSYRLTYRYDFYRSSTWETGIGFTAKIRDASIKLSGPDKTSEKKNTGFVPIIHFRILALITPKLNLLVSGDALAAPQGRAEDVLFAGIYNLKDNFSLKLGYRFLEGGADNDTVYNFALVHYLVMGTIINF